MPRQPGEWILALDVGTDSGYAIRKLSTEEIHSGSFSHKRKQGDHPGKRYVEFEKCLDSLANDYAISRVCCEEPMGNFKSHVATLVVCGYVGVVQAWCARMKLPFVGYPQKAVKKKATGKGNARKPEMISAARAKWPHLGIKTDDEADALWVLELDRQSVDTTTG